MKVTIVRSLYDLPCDFKSLVVDCLVDALDRVKALCGGVVWEEKSQTRQIMPDGFVYVDTYYGINVYFNSVSKSFLFEEF